MRSDSRDQEIIRLLTKIKEVEQQYPPELLTARRQHYLKSIAGISLATGAAASARQVLKNAGTVPASAIAGKLLETVLIVAIVAEAATVTYFYRDKLAEFFRRAVSSPPVPEVTAAPVFAHSETPAPATPSPGFTATYALPTDSAAPTQPPVSVTPGPEDMELVDPDNPGVTQPATEVNSTPVPKDNSGDNGNHYGQTPKPERTKEPENDNKPPEDDNSGPPAEKDPKPTKSK